MHERKRKLLVKEDLLGVLENVILQLALPKFLYRRHATASETYEPEHLYAWHFCLAYTYFYKISYLILYIFIFLNFISTSAK